jgi:pyridoxamine 5'-phosphate oxidase
VEIERSRRTYDLDSLLEERIERDPFIQLQRWLAEAITDAGAIEANAMTLATADRNGRPSARVVLLRGLDARGLRFFTSYLSRKGEELAVNPFAAACFYWPHLERQVRVEGDVQRLSDEESDEYFASRPRGHRLAAWASEQTAPIERRELLAERYEHFDERFEGEEVPRPHSWGGYVLQPDRFEFWQGRPNRLHDRIAFIAVDGGWRAQRIQP